MPMNGGARGAKGSSATRSVTPKSKAGGVAKKVKGAKGNTAKAAGQKTVRGASTQAGKMARGSAKGKTGSGSPYSS